MRRFIGYLTLMLCLLLAHKDSERELMAANRAIRKNKEEENINKQQLSMRLW